MRAPLQITFRGFQHSAALDEQIRKQAEKLETFHQRLIECHVVVDKPRNHQHHDKLYGLHITLALPGKTLVATHHAHKDFFTAVRLAFDDIQRQLKKTSNKTRQASVRADKETSLISSGRVVQVFPGKQYGFIEDANGEEIYFNERSIKHASKKLKIGTDVKFTKNKMGLEAVKLRIKKPAH